MQMMGDSSSAAASSSTRSNGNGNGNGASDPDPDPRTTTALILSMQWSLAEERLARHPAEAHAVVAPLGEASLATACRMKAAPSLIAALLDANPDAALAASAVGKTPLHLWCSDLRRTSRGVGFDDDVSVVRMILDARPRAAAIPDADGWLPLHCACAAGSSASVELFRCLVSACPRSVTTKNKGGVTPLRMLWDRCALNLEEGRCILSVDAARFHERAVEMERIAASNAYNRSGRVRPLGNSASVWAKVLLMAKAAYMGSLDEADERNEADERTTDAFRPLHAIAGIDCPVSLVNFAIQVHSRDPGALDGVDGKGNLPLHVAALRQHDDSLENEDVNEFDADRGGAIVALSSASPQAIGRRNMQGRLPLVLAIESGASWDSGGVRHLIEKLPEIAEERDEVTGLYPFMLAASVGSVEVSFELFRRNPDLVGPSAGDKSIMDR
ncbi:hypothetical protein ACHAWF_008933 [Thalassiosira exigua]